MKFEILYQPAHSLAIAHLQPGESVRAEAGAMVGMTTGVEIETTGGHKKGGLLKGLGRALLGGETFFTNLYKAPGDGAQVSLAPSLCGDMVTHDLSGESLIIQGSSYVAAPDTVELDTKFQGFKGFFSGESLFFLQARGSGPVLLNAFGGIETIDLDGELVVDTGHLVAFTEGISYTVEKAGSGWIASFLSGEGLVLKMSGRGRLYLQTRNPNEYGKTVGSKLPARES